MIPADNLGLADRFGGDWLAWLGTFSRNEKLPGDGAGTGREMTAVGFAQRALQLIMDFIDSQEVFASPGLSISASPTPPSSPRSVGAVQRGILRRTFRLANPTAREGNPGDILERALCAIRDEIDYENRPDHRRAWLLVSLVTAVVRGIVIDKLVTDARGFRAINDEDFGDWIMRHGGHPDVLEFPLVARRLRPGVRLRGRRP